MRQKDISYLPLEFEIVNGIDEQQQSNSAIVRQVCDFYKRLSKLLDDNPDILDLVHEDLQIITRANRTKATVGGRRAFYSSKNIFYACLVKKFESVTCRNATFQIAQSKILHDFCDLGPIETVDYSLICRAEKAIESKTWEAINQKLRTIGIKQGCVDPSEARMDATVVESEVHYPTDVHQLWDCYRSISLRIRRILTTFTHLPKLRFHNEKTKKYYLDVTRYARSTSKTRKLNCRQWTRKLIRRVSETLQRVDPLVQNAIEHLNSLSNKACYRVIESDLNWLTSRFPVMRKIVDIARRRLQGASVPNEEKVFSLFEDHVELIKRGRAGIPFELGHKIFLSQSRSKFILDYCVLEKCKSDTELLEQMVTRHEKQFGAGALKIVHADKGCRSVEPKMKQIQQRIETVHVPSRLKDLHEPELAESQKFRAGIEGSISCLKRKFQLGKTKKRGFKSFCSEIGASIFCHNLRLLCRWIPPDKLEPASS